MMFQKATSPVKGEYDVVVVADSISPANHRIITLEVTMPRMILAEFNTHRMFSRNSASSRAIPFAKMSQTVMETAFVPLAWMKDHKGMQGNSYLDAETSKKAEEIWLRVRDAVVAGATELNQLNVTKQMCNRLLEPFMWHKVLVTSTEWENFFAQRFEGGAEIHMQHIAEMMLESINSSVPRSLLPGNWHLPYSDHINVEEFKNFTMYMDAEERLEIMKQVCTMRCAQTSYTIVGEDGKPMDLTKLLETFRTKLLPMGHWSPFEHPAECMSECQMDRWVAGKGKQRGWCGNFRGWKQYRKSFDHENRVDFRFIRKQHGATN